LLRPLTVEATPAGEGQSLTPYCAPWFAGAAWGTLLGVAYPFLVLTPLAAFAALTPRFTAAIGQAKPGDLAMAHGPFGRFSHVFHPSAGDLVFVAAGVGITPLMSMLRSMRDRREARRVLLVYANRGVTDIVFRRELESIQAGGFPALRTVHVLSQPPANWDGPTGRLNTGSLWSLCGDFSGKTFFICCPPAMAAGLIRGLQGAGVGLGRIHADYFGL
jgi:ferredoxin-NADP reductase